MEYVRPPSTYKIIPWDVIYKAGKSNNGHNFQYTDQPLVRFVTKIKEKITQKIRVIKRIIKKEEVKQPEPLKKEVPVVITRKQVNEQKDINSNYNIRGFVCFPVNNLSTNSTRTAVS